MASVAQTPQDVPEWRRSTEQDTNPRPRKGSTREGNRGNRGGRGRGRGGNGGGPPRKEPAPASQEAPAPTPKVVVDPPTTANTPEEPSSAPKLNSRPKPAKRNSATISEDSNSVSSQTSARPPPNRRRKSQQGRRPSISSNSQNKHLSVQTSGRRPSTEPSSPNLAKDQPPHLDTPVPTTPSTELKSDIDTLVERVRAAAMDRPHTPGSHIDWADDDDSLPDLHDWGYPGEVTNSMQPEDPQTAIPPIFEDAPLETEIPEVKVEGEEPPPIETKPQDTQPGPVSNPTPQTHKVQKTRSKRGGRLRGDPRTQHTPPSLNLSDSVSQDSSLSPIQPTSAPATHHSGKPQGGKRQNPNQGQNSRNNQGRTTSRDNGNGGGRQRGQNGVIVASPMRNSFPTKAGPKANHTPPVEPQAPAQGPDVAQPATNPPADPNPKPAEPKVDPIPDKERKKGKPSESPRKPDTIEPNLDPTTTRNPPNEPEPTQDDAKPSSPHNRRNRNSYNPSHSRSHTYGGRTQGGPPHSASTPNFPHNSPDTNLNSSPTRNPRPHDTNRSPGNRSAGLGPTQKSPGFERHNRNHSSPPGVGGAIRQPHSTRPLLTESAFSQLGRLLGSAPGSPKKEPPVSPPTS